MLILHVLSIPEARGVPPWKLNTTIKVDILWLIKVLIGVKFEFWKQDFPKVWMKCLEIARMKDFAPNTPGLLGVAQGPQIPCREVRDSRCVSTNPSLEIPAYGPVIYSMLLIVKAFFTLNFFAASIIWCLLKLWLWCTL